jgi:hypothetical protein
VYKIQQSVLLLLLLLQHFLQLQLHRLIQLDLFLEVPQVVTAVLLRPEALEGLVVLGFLQLGGLELYGFVLEEVLGEDDAVGVAADPGGLGFVLDVGGLG